MEIENNSNNRTGPNGKWPISKTVRSMRKRFNYVQNTFHAIMMYFSNILSSEFLSYSAVLLITWLLLLLLRLLLPLGYFFVVVEDDNFIYKLPASKSNYTFIRRYLSTVSGKRSHNLSFFLFVFFTYIQSLSRSFTQWECSRKKVDKNKTRKKHHHHRHCRHHHQHHYQQQQKEKNREEKSYETHRQWSE